VRSSEITNRTARHENVFNYMGMWAKVLNEHTNQYDGLRTKLQCGNPACGCSEFEGGSDLCYDE